MTMSDPAEVVWRGTYLEMHRQGRWEFATRRGSTGIVAIVAITDDRCVVLVEQHRPPVRANVIELPAGLVGDHEGAEGEPMVEAAKRELLEETGYRASRWRELVTGLSSAGLTDEALTIYLADGLTKVGPGGGAGSERITVHEPPLDGVWPWLQEKMSAGLQIDLKLLAGLYAAERETARQ
jgi:ADP-ribose pyrophosphatase